MFKLLFISTFTMVPSLGSNIPVAKKSDNMLYYIAKNPWNYSSIFKVQDIFRSRIKNRCYRGDPFLSLILSGAVPIYRKNLCFPSKKSIILGNKAKIYSWNFDLLDCIKIRKTLGGKICIQNKRVPLTWTVFGSVAKTVSKIFVKKIRKKWSYSDQFF